MHATFTMRVASSLKALGIIWLLSGIVFMIVTRGPDRIQAWCIWGTGFFAIGWIFVGLPLIALGEWLDRAPYSIFAMIAGFGGALIFALPSIILSIINPAAVGRWDFILRSSLAWEGIGFAIGASSALLYRVFLDQDIHS